MPSFSPPPGQMPGDHLFTGPCEAGETWGAGPQVLVDKSVNVAVPLAFGLSLPARPCVWDTQLPDLCNFSLPLPVHESA